VPAKQQSELPETAIQTLEVGLRWERDKVLERSEIIASAIEFSAMGIRPHIQRFLGAVPARNPWAMSPLMTAASLHGLTTERVDKCPIPDSLDFGRVCDHAAAKLGTFLAPHSDLGYTAVDAATLTLATEPEPNDGCWLPQVCADIQGLGDGSKLADLVKITSKTLGGNKYTRTRVLEALVS